MVITNIWNVTFCSHSSGSGYFCRYDAAPPSVPQAISNQEGITANNLNLFVVEIDSIASFNYSTDELDIGVFLQFERNLGFVIRHPICGRSHH